MVCAVFGADLGKITNVPGVLNALTKSSMTETDLIGCFEIGLMQVIQPHLIFFEVRVKCTFNFCPTGGAVVLENRGTFPCH